MSQSYTPIPRKYGCISSAGDPTDKSPSFIAAAIHLPDKCNVWSGKQKLGVLNQGSAGDCVANAWSRAMRYQRVNQGMDDLGNPSRLQIYYNARVYQGVDPMTDTGTYVHLGGKACQKQGAVFETEYPYDLKKLNDALPDSVIADGLAHVVTKRMKITQDLHAMKACLASNQPIVVGIHVYKGMEAAECYITGNVPMPGPKEKSIGGHCILVTGYNESEQEFDFDNSWGSVWGHIGSGKIPYGYLTDPGLAYDFWTISNVGA